MRDAIVFSTWSWETFNVPERVALALVSQGSRVLYCEMPVSRFRRHGKELTEIESGLYVFGPEYAGGRLSRLPFAGERQWKSVAEQISAKAEKLGLRNPVFLYSHVDGTVPLCAEMKARGFTLVHICMDYPEPYQYELIDRSDKTLVIPKSVFHKLRARYGEKVHWIPQSIHLSTAQNGQTQAAPPELGNVPRPRLGYLGPLYGRVSLVLMRAVLGGHPDWQFVYFGDSEELNVPNAHSAGWHKPQDLAPYVAFFDVGVMPYDCFDEKNLHCSPLKLFDYFLAGLPVVSTPILSLSEYSDLVYVGETPTEFAEAIKRALEEPVTSPKRDARREVAREHSTELLGRRISEILQLGGKQESPH
jgi:Glycosyl transferases group 1